MTPAFDISLGGGDAADRNPGQSLPIEVLYDEPDLQLVAKETFRYLPDPVIEKFYPKDTIVE